MKSKYKLARDDCKFITVTVETIYPYDYPNDELYKRKEPLVSLFSSFSLERKGRTKRN